MYFPLQSVILSTDVLLSKHHNPGYVIGWSLIWTEGLKYPLIPQMYTYNPHGDTH